MLCFYITFYDIVYYNLFYFSDPMSLDLQIEAFVKAIKDAQ